MSAALMKCYTAIFVASIYLCISPTAYASAEEALCISEITAFGGSSFDDMDSHEGWVRIGYFDVGGGGGYAYDKSFDETNLGSYFVGLYYKTSSKLQECFAGIAMTFADEMPPNQKTFTLASGTSSDSSSFQYSGKKVAVWDVDKGGGQSAIDNTNGSYWGALYALDPVTKGRSVLTQIGLAGTDSEGAIVNPPLGWNRVATFDIEDGGGNGNMGCGQPPRQQSGSCGNYDYSLYQMRVGQQAETTSVHGWQLIGNTNEVVSAITDGLSISDGTSFSSELSASVSASYTASYEVLSGTTTYSFASQVTRAKSETRKTNSSSTKTCNRTFSGDKTAWQYKFTTTGQDGNQISDYGFCIFACSESPKRQPKFTPWDKDFSKRAKDSCR